MAAYNTDVLTVAFVEMVTGNTSCTQYAENAAASKRIATSNAITSIFR